jgi:hypothetical protein
LRIPQTARSILDYPVCTGITSGREYTDLKRNFVPAQSSRLFRRLRRVNAMIAGLSLMLLAACGGPDLATPTDYSPTPTAMPTVARPTAAVGRTTGASCESGTLRVKDLPQIEKRWRDGLSVARGRAAKWKEDAVLIELGISCELFEPGFRWQATFFSRDAQAYYRSDTTEVIPVNTDPDAIIPLPDSEINFERLHEVLMTSQDVDANGDDPITALDVRVSTQLQPIGPPGVPTGAAIYHVALRTRGMVLELYIDAVQGQIYRFE